MGCKYVNMADTKKRDGNPAANLLYLRDQELREGIELLFYAYRDFTSDPDRILETYGYGRAHHRVIHFVGRHPDITVSALLGILRITKQSLGRVLKALVEDGFIDSVVGEQDRRNRHLRLTDTGRALENALSAPQRERVARAFREAGPEAVAGYRKVLEGLINEEGRTNTLKRIYRN